MARPGNGSPASFSMNGRFWSGTFDRETAPRPSRTVLKDRPGGTFHDSVLASSVQSDSRRASP
ncbi:hypothetical protein JK185_14075 [Gluconobacter wancherniae]|uniref:hypothetical protein n=1 Tax=Gluconobacter wancherniae TaxID=1307955 RepID=UPI001B8C80E7|nr:hypothetical protein [Gluconobacter wancherniae]MBS1064132.1 hypothetical protein [Gluconobacter wancherniae]